MAQEFVQLQTRGAKRYSKKKPKDFRVLLVYPNIQQSAMMPYSMGLFTSLLREKDFQVDLFDSTFYAEPLTDNYIHYRTFVKQFDWLDRDVHFRQSSMLEDFRAKVAEYQPDLIAVSVVENTYSVGRAMIRALPEKGRRIPTIWGGPFATFAPDFILRDHVGDYVCRGEGEIALIELCERMCEGRSVTDIPNLWVREDGQLYRNPLGPRVDLDQLPFADYSLFEEQAIYRPMEGKLWRTIGIESQRGCPFQCTYCNSPGQNRIANAEQGSKFYRRKSLDRTMAGPPAQGTQHRAGLLAGRHLPGVAHASLRRTRRALRRLPHPVLDEHPLRDDDGAHRRRAGTHEHAPYQHRDRARQPRVPAQDAQTVPDQRPTAQSLRDLLGPQLLHDRQLHYRDARGDP
jgi:hypothetical protein